MQWLAFRNDGKYSAADYAKISSEKMSKNSQTLWNGLEIKEMIRCRRYFILKLLQSAMAGLAFMHEHDRLHQSLGPSSIILKYMFPLGFLLQFAESLFHVMLVLIYPIFYFVKMMQYYCREGSCIFDPKASGSSIFC